MGQQTKRVTSVLFMVCTVSSHFARLYLPWLVAYLRVCSVFGHLWTVQSATHVQLRIICLLVVTTYDRNKLLVWLLWLEAALCSALMSAWKWEVGAGATD